jgi:hypothetical protein
MWETEEVEAKMKQTEHCFESPNIAESLASLGNPDAFVIDDLIHGDHRFSRLCKQGEDYWSFIWQLQDLGYVRIPSYAKDGKWVIYGTSNKRYRVFGKAALSIGDRIKAVTRLRTEKGFWARKRTRIHRALDPREAD